MHSWRVKACPRALPDAQLVNNSVQVDLMVADMHYLPAVR
jgi:hypothetical protein